MAYRQYTVSSLILGRSDLRGFCLFMSEIFSMGYRQKNPLKYYVQPFLLATAVFGLKKKVINT
jgi:hypothetical protein